MCGLPSVNNFSKSMFSPKAKGTSPNMVAVAVKITGVILVFPASTMASKVPIPCSFNKSVNSTKRIPFRTTIPAKAIIPTPLITTENSILNNEKPINTPIMLNSISTKIITGLAKELNWVTNITKININEVSKAPPRNAPVSACSSWAPANFISTPSGATNDFISFCTSATTSFSL